MTGRPDAVPGTSMFIAVQTSDIWDLILASAYGVDSVESVSVTKDSVEDDPVQGDTACFLTL